MAFGKFLILIGNTGSGKTSVAKHLSAYYHIPWFDLDQEIEARYGQTVGQLFSSGEENFRKAETETLKSFLLAQAQTSGFILATGGGTAPNNLALFKFATEQNPTFRIIWLKANSEAMINRLSHSQEISKRPMLFRAPDLAARIKYLELVRNPLYAEVTTLLVDTSNLTLSEVVETIIIRLD